MYTRGELDIMKIPKKLEFITRSYAIFRKFTIITIIFTIIVVSSISRIQADTRIVIHLTHAPEEVIRNIEQEYKTARDPHKILGTDITPSELSTKQLKSSIRKHLTPALSGFMTIYGGYIDVSDPDGLISFPLRHDEPKLYIAITPEVKLVNIRGKTFSHQEYIVNEQNPVKLYSFEKKQDEDKKSYWDVQEITAPEDKAIDHITTIILSKPKNLFIQTGHFFTVAGEQFVLPPIYVLGNKDKEKILLKTLDLQNYFERIKIEKKKPTENTEQKLITNI